MMKRFSWSACSLLALLFGAVLYSLYRQDTYIGQLIHPLFPVALPVNGWFSAFLAFYFPDYLWMFSMTCALFAILLPRQKETIFWCVIAFSVGAIWELLQQFRIVSGTADLHDVILYSLAVFSAAIIKNTERIFKK